VLELVVTTTPYLFQTTSMSVCLWLIDKTKTDKNIYFLDADAGDYKNEKYSTWHNKRKILTEQNIKDIGNKDNWLKASLEQIAKQNYILVPARYEFSEEKERSKEEIDAELKQTIQE
jgi:type I restriction-modification system DNA methylase subunit